MVEKENNLENEFAQAKFMYMVSTIQKYLIVKYLDECSNCNIPSFILDMVIAEKIQKDIAIFTLSGELQKRYEEAEYFLAEKGVA